MRKNFVFCVAIVALVLLTLLSGVNLKSIEGKYGEILAVNDNNRDGISIYEIEDSRDATTQSESTSQEYATYATQYFSNLDYHGINTNGTCAYVALGMFLSYFDTYWNDNIISEQYDKTAFINGVEANNYIKSPGIYDVATSGRLSDADYANYMRTQASTNFHAYLLTLGESLGFFRNDSNPRLGLVFNETNALLNKYLELHDIAENFYCTYVFYEGEDGFTDAHPHHESMRQSIISYVKLGLPVMVSIGGNSGGHVVIAHDYDEVTDTIYANFGWYSQHNRAPLLGTVGGHNFSYIKGYIVGTPQNCPHIHSNNYVLPSGETLCSCRLSTHEHSFSYPTKSALQHKKTCYCGHQEFEPHNYRIDLANNLYVCKFCGYCKEYDGGSVISPYYLTAPNVVEDMERIADQVEREHCEMRAL